MAQQAIGIIETKGLIAAIEATDTALKAANVSFTRKDAVGSGFVAITVEGDVAAVKAAVDAGADAARRDLGQCDPEAAQRGCQALAPSPGTLGFTPRRQEICHVPRKSQWSCGLNGQGPVDDRHETAGDRASANPVPESGQSSWQRRQPVRCRRRRL